MDQKASDNKYLHKDFHGALCYAIKYLDENYGRESTAEYLKRVGNTYFAPLSGQLKNDGLPVLEKHFRSIFEAEKSTFTIKYENDILIIDVQICPAIAHLKQTGQLWTDRFCESTVFVNKTISETAGYCSSCVYLPGKGICVQKFWKDK